MEIGMNRVITFKEYLIETEYGYSKWSKAASVLLLARIRNLTNQIKRERDQAMKLDLIAQQNNQLAGIGTLGIAVFTGDKSIAG
jgi:hypothetical protein